jgi:hypothetical protein
LGAGSAPSFGKASDKTTSWINWSYYPNTDWASQTQWDEFLNAWAI